MSEVLSEDLVEQYKYTTLQLTLWLAQMQKFADRLEKGLPVNKKKYVYAASMLADYKKYFLEDKKALGFDDGFQFLEDNRFIGFYIQDGKLHKEVDNDEIYRIVDKWFYGFPVSANHYQFEVATYVVSLSEEKTREGFYPKELEDDEVAVL